MRVSVVVPTYNRADVLRRTLALYAAQTVRPQDFEVIVIDDASTDGTEQVLAGLSAQSPAPLPYQLITERLARNAGPSAARNRGLAHACGDLVLFAGDDMLPAPDFIAAHRDWHLHHPQPAAAMVGHIGWSPEMPPTPLLHWLERNGTQFHYGDMRDGDTVPFDRFYTGNTSVKRALLATSAERFDERLRFCEDSEFASRLARHGMTLHYHAAARAAHLHPTDLHSSLRRMRALGQAVAAMEQTVPETFARVTAGVMGRHAGWRGRLIRLVLARPLGRTLYQPLAALCERRIFADRIFALAHASAVLEGVLSGQHPGACAA